jgi:hypothetical protein
MDHGAGRQRRHQRQQRGSEGGRDRSIEHNHSRLEPVRWMTVCLRHRTFCELLFD